MGGRRRPSWARAASWCNPRRRRAVWSRTSLTPFALATSRDGGRRRGAPLAQEGPGDGGVPARVGRGALGAWAFAGGGLRWGRDGDLPRGRRRGDPRREGEPRCGAGGRAGRTVVPLACEQGRGSAGGGRGGRRRCPAGAYALYARPSGRPTGAWSWRTATPSLHVVRPGAGDVDLAFTTTASRPTSSTLARRARRRVHREDGATRAAPPRPPRRGARRVRAEGSRTSSGSKVDGRGRRALDRVLVAEPRTSSFELWRVSLTAGGAQRVTKGAGECGGEIGSALQRVGPASQRSWACLDLDPRPARCSLKRPWASPRSCSTTTAR